MVAGFTLSGCTSVRYYAQAARGQAELIVHRHPIERVLANPHTDPQLAARLRLALQARRFASRELGLPDNRSYTGYVPLDRDYVVWNVFAAPRYSVQAVPQCFPIAGCVAYRGWFSEQAAQADAARWSSRGDDVWIGQGAVILKGVRIGDRAVIGAQAVVTRNVPSDCVVAGNPARVVRSLIVTEEPDCLALRGRATVGA